VTTGGSYTNSQKVIQQSDSHESFDTKLQKNNIEQLSDLLVNFGSAEYADVDDVMAEFITLLPLKLKCKHTFEYTKTNSASKLFNYGCDSVVKYFEEDFNQKMKLTY
ncbi:MAG: hypothetical protein WCK29_04350, partial [archaeon]